MIWYKLAQWAISLGQGGCSQKQALVRFPEFLNRKESYNEQDSSQMAVSTIYKLQFFQVFPSYPPPLCTGIGEGGGTVTKIKEILMDKYVYVLSNTSLAAQL